MKTIDFNTDWLFQKIGEDAVPVHLPHDAMLTEVRTVDCHTGEKTGYFPGGKYIYQKDFWLDRQREDGVLELLQNNVSLGVKKLKDFRASFTTTYKAGSLIAIARSADGSQIGESLLSTGQKETILKVKPEKETLFVTGQD